MVDFSTISERMEKRDEKIRKEQRKLRALLSRYKHNKKVENITRELYGIDIMLSGLNRIWIPDDDIDMIISLLKAIKKTLKLGDEK